MAQKEKPIKKNFKVWMLILVGLIFAALVPKVVFAQIEEKVRREADYILACQFISVGDPAHGAFNDVYGAPTWVVPRENGMAILALIKASTILADASYKQRADLSMDYLISIQDATDGAWCDQYSYQNPVVLSKSPTMTAEVIMAMHALGYRADRYPSMKKGAQYLLQCQSHGYGGLICGGKDASGNFYTDNWTSDNSYAYLAFKATREWALNAKDTAFADQCKTAAAQILTGINFVLRNAPVWHQKVNSSGVPSNPPSYDWINYAPHMLDLPATGVGDAAVGEWIHSTFQLSNGGCIGPDTDKEYPGLSFQAALCWLDLSQATYVNNAITWSEGSGLWQTTPDYNGISGGWIDWKRVSNPSQTEVWWMRFIDTSFYAIASWSGGYNFNPYSKCFVATVAYGTPMAEEIESLSEFRDNYLMTNACGRKLVEFYYTHSPSAADYIKDKPGIKALVRFLLKPLVWASKKLEK